MARYVWTRHAGLPALGVEFARELPRLIAELVGDAHFLVGKVEVATVEPWLEGRRAR